MQLKELYSFGKENLRQNAIESPGLEAFILLSESKAVSDFSEIYAHPEKEIGADSLNKFQDLITRRLKREPISYITGEKEFYSRSFKVNSDVLIPRPETELLVDETYSIAKNIESPKILDIGTGSGCISVTLADLCGQARVIASDISEKALSVAKENIAKHGKEDNISLAKADLLEPFKDSSFDIIVSNPPYISESEIDVLEPDVKDYEPLIALTGGSDGLKYIRLIIKESKRVLKNEGWCVLEIGHNQASLVEKIFEENSFTDISAIKDINNIYRVIKAKWKK